MGLYAKYVLPHVIDLSMRNKETARVRGDWVPRARGDVLEIGIGSGLNLPFYSGEVSRVFGVDPSPELQKLARKRSVGKAIHVEFLLQTAEEPLPLPDQSVDTVLLTWTLCSIADPPRALRQMKRVLKPCGRLIFVEHGRAREIHSQEAAQESIESERGSPFRALQLAAHIPDETRGVGLRCLDTGANRGT